MSYDHLRDQGRNPLAYFYGQQAVSEYHQQGTGQQQELPETNRTLRQQNEYYKFDPDEDPSRVSVTHLNVSILYFNK